MQISCASAGATYELRHDQNKVVRKGTTPATLTDVPVGNYQLVCWLHDTRSRIEPIQVEQNETLAKDFEFCALASST